MEQTKHFAEFPTDAYLADETGDPLIAHPCFTPLPPAPADSATRDPSATERIAIKPYLTPLPLPPAPVDLAAIKPEAPKPVTAGTIIESYFGAVKTPIEYLCLLTGRSVLPQKDEAIVAFLSDEKYAQKKSERGEASGRQWEDDEYFDWDDRQMLLYERVRDELGKMGNKRFNRKEMKQIVNQVWSSMDEVRADYKKEAEGWFDVYRSLWARRMRETGEDTEAIERSITLHKSDLFSRYRGFFDQETVSIQAEKPESAIPYLTVTRLK